MSGDRPLVLVTGAAGFVGGHLVAHLARSGRYRVAAGKLPSERVAAPEEGADDVDVLDLDILDPAGVARAVASRAPRYVVHLAAQSSVARSWEDPAGTFALNVQGTLAVLDAVRAAGNPCRVLLVGSSEQYGRVRPEDLPVRETAPMRPENPYAVSKLAQEQLARLYVEAHGMDLVLVRSFNQIGPGQAPGFVVSDFARQVAGIERGERAPVVRVGNLTARRDFTDVRDAVRAYEALLRAGRAGEAYNVGQGRSVAVDEVLGTLVGLSRVPVSVEVDPAKVRPADVLEIVADVAKVRAETGWEPQVPLAASLRDALDAWRRC